MKKAVHILAFILCYIGAQGQVGNNWTFGHYMGFNFSTEPPQMIYSNLKASTKDWDGYDDTLYYFSSESGFGASISYCNGDLALYGNAEVVKNSNHEELDTTTITGSNTKVHLLSDPGSSGVTNRVLIFKSPAEDSVFFYYTPYNKYTLRYARIDMRLKNGRGSAGGWDNLIKLNGPTRGSNASTWARHANGVDYWLIIKDFNRKFYTYLVNSTGISATPIVSSDLVYNSSNYVSDAAFMQLKTSHSNKKLALSGVNIETSAPNSTYLLDFDNATGQISNPQPVLQYADHPYHITAALEFSPNDSLLYVSTHWDRSHGDNWPYSPDVRSSAFGPFSWAFDTCNSTVNLNNNPASYNSIFQVELYNNNKVHLLDKLFETFVANKRCPSFNLIGSFELAPNNKIYATYHKELSIFGNATPVDKHLSIIHRPNEIGQGCKLELEAINVGPVTPGYILPNTTQDHRALSFKSNLFASACQDSASFQYIGDTTAYSQVTWYFGDGDSLLWTDGEWKTAEPFHHLYTQNGMYNVVLKAIDTIGACSHTVWYSDSVMIRYKPRQMLSVEQTSECYTTSILITDSISNATQWYLDWGSSDTLLNTQADSTYTFELAFSTEDTLVLTSRVQNTNCISTELDTSYLVFLPKPEQRLSIDAKVSSQVDDTLYLCLNGELVLLDSSTSVQSAYIDWDDAQTGTYSDTILLQQGVAQTYSSAGLKSIIVSDTNLVGCVSTDTLYTRVVQLPSTAISVNNAEQCENNQEIVWDFPASDYSMFDTVSHYRVNYGDGTTDSIGVDSTDDRHTFTSPGSYTYWFMPQSVIGCIDTGFSTVDVYPAPDAFFVLGDTIVCEKEEVFLNNFSSIASGSIDSVELDWSDVVLRSSSITNAKHIYDQAGLHLVRLTAFSDKMCLDTLTSEVRVSPLPVAGISELDDELVKCFDGHEFNLINTSTVSTGGVDSSYWSFGDGTESISTGSESLDNQLKSYASDGQYEVQVIINTDYGCSDTANASLEVNPNPEARLSTKDVCEGDSSSFEVLATISSGVIASEDLSFGDGTSTSQNLSGNLIKHSYDKADSYRVIFTVSSDKQCSDTDRVIHQVSEVPDASFTHTLLGTDGAKVKVNFVNTSSGDYSEVFWDLGDGTQLVNQEMLDHLYSDTGRLDLKLIVLHTDGCSDSMIQSLLIYPKPLVWIPSAFSPNGDGLNDVYKPITFGIEHYTMTIYDRYGQKVAELDQNSAGWDAVDYAPGTYMVVIHAKGTDNLWYNVKETVTVVR